MSLCQTCGGNGRTIDASGFVVLCRGCDGTGYQTDTAASVEAGPSRGAVAPLAPEGQDAPTVLAAIVAWFPDCAQLLDGWHSDGTAWTEYDESIRKRLAALWSKALAVLPPQASSDGPSRGTSHSLAPEGTDTMPGRTIHLGRPVPVEVIDAGWIPTWQSLPDDEQVMELAVLSGGDAPYVYRAFGCRTDSGDGWLWALATYGIPDHPNDCEADDDYDVIAWRRPTSLPEAPAIRRFKVLRDREEDGQEVVAVVTGRDKAQAIMREIGLAARCEEIAPDEDGDEPIGPQDPADLNPEPMNHPQLDSVRNENGSHR